MRTISLIINATLLTISIFTQSFAEENLDQAIAKIESAWQKITTLKADVSATASLPINETYIQLKGIGELLIAKDKTQEKFLQRISAYPASLLESGNTSILNSPMASAQVLFDGTDYYITYKLLTNQETNKTQPDLTKGAIPPGGKKLFDTAKEKLNIALSGEVELDGKKMPSFKLIPKDSSDFAEANLVINPDYGIIRKLEVVGKENKPLFICEYTNIKTEISIPPETFSLPAPPTSQSTNPESSSSQGVASTTTQPQK